MPRTRIHDILVISYDTSPGDRYWTELSNHIIARHGNATVTDHAIVETILIDCFKFLCDQFRQLLQAETSFKFFQYIFYLHEESIKLYKLVLQGAKLNPIDEDEFAMYRRVLKNILEQGCDNDLVWGEMPDAKKMAQMDEGLQDLLYLGTWIYAFADMIAFQKMVERCHWIQFKNGNVLSIDWQYHYGKLYHSLFPQLRADYEKGTFDMQAFDKLKAAIEDCFGIEYAFAGRQIFDIKKSHSELSSQTIQADVLPQNLVLSYGITEELAKAFYDGLTLSRQNKMSLEDLVYKPYSMDRHMYRPILIYRIGGEDRALVGFQKFNESIITLATNAMHWNTLPKEWLRNRDMQLFMNKMGREHDKILEDEIQNILESENLLFVRNVKSFKQADGQDNININNQVAGEIDFIVVNTKLKKIYVADVKYNRARYESVGFRNDLANFISNYEPKLTKKINWVGDNIQVVQNHMRIIYNLPLLDLAGFSVEGAFFINTPTFYMFNGNYKAITLHSLRSYVTGRFENKKFIYLNEDPEADNMYDVIEHPYFKQK